MALETINRIFPQNPTRAEVNYEFKTKISTMENGNILTRDVWNRPKRHWSLVWSNLYPEHRVMIRDFYLARKGMYDKFLFMAYTDENDDNHSMVTGTAGANSTSSIVYLENYPAKDGIYNNWCIEVGLEKKIVSNYDGATGKITLVGAFGSSSAGKPYILHQTLGNTDSSGTLTQFSFYKNYSSHTETKKYIYREGNPENSLYQPVVYKCDLSSGIVTQYTETTDYTFATNESFTDGSKKYSIAPINFNVAPADNLSICAKFYYAFPVRFEDALNETLFSYYLYNLNTVRLVEILEPS